MNDDELTEKARSALEKTKADVKYLRATDDGLERFLLEDEGHYNKMLEAVVDGRDTILRVTAPGGAAFEADFAQIKRVVGRMIDHWPNPSPQLVAAIVEWMTDKDGAA